MIRSRSFLQTEFADGERPSGQDFSDTFDSFIHQGEDGLTLDNDNNLIVESGVTIGDSTNEVGGTIRFQGGVFQFFNGAQWDDLGTGSGGAFQPAGIAGEVTYEGGNVGVNVATPTYRFEVDIAANTDTSDRSDRIRLGPGVLTRGTAPTGTQDWFYLMHQEVFEGGDPADEFALATDPDGNVVLNAAQNGRVFLAVNNDLGNGVVITDEGLAIGNNFLTVPQFGEQGLTDPADADTSRPVRLYVAGNAAKGTPGQGFINTSDERTKEDITELKDGLDKLSQIEPVRFRYNGKAHTAKGARGIGVIAQALEKVFPEMIFKGKARLDDENEETDILLTDTSSLIFVAINAIKELAEKVERLETQLGKAGVA